MTLLFQYTRLSGLAACLLYFVILFSGDLPPVFFIFCLGCLLHAIVVFFAILNPEKPDANE